MTDKDVRGVFGRELYETQAVRYASLYTYRIAERVQALSPAMAQNY